MNTPTAPVTITPAQHESIKTHIANAVRKTGHVAEKSVEVVAEVALEAVFVAALADSGASRA